MPRRKKTTVEQVVEGKPEGASRTPKYIDTGSTLLNLALSDNPFGGWRAGTIANLIGDSSTGKTLALLTSMALNHLKNPEYTNVHDDVEAGVGFNLGDMFGETFAESLEPPHVDKDGLPEHSNEIEGFQANIMDWLSKSEPFYYGLDSLDALDSCEDKKHREKQNDAYRKESDATGTYGMAKAKMMSTMLRGIKQDIDKTESFLNIISQVRDNIGNPFNPKYVAGGKALEFYCWHRVFLSHVGFIKAKDRKIGVKTRAKVGKNRETGKLREVDFSIYYDIGIDDVGSCVDFLLSENHWEKRKQTVIATEFEVEYTTTKLIEHIETNDLETELRKIVGKVWNGIEDSISLKGKRKKRVG